MFILNTFSDLFLAIKIQKRSYQMSAMQEKQTKILKRKQTLRQWTFLKGKCIH